MALLLQVLDLELDLALLEDVAFYAFYVYGGFQSCILVETKLKRLDDYLINIGDRGVWSCILRFVSLSSNETTLFYLLKILQFVNFLPFFANQLTMLGLYLRKINILARCLIGEDKVCADSTLFELVEEHRQCDYVFILLCLPRKNLLLEDRI